MTIRDYIASALRGVYTCDSCGALVANTDTHDEWHDELEGNDHGPGSFPAGEALVDLAWQTNQRIPMYKQDGLLGAWYPAALGEEPDGWLTLRMED